MRKLRKAAFVVAMIGSLSMAGAGVASADDSNKGKEGDTTVCVIEANDNSFSLITIPDLTLPILSSSSRTQQLQNVCGEGNTGVQVNETTQDTDIAIDLGLL
ncbi:hypothetical protein [Streptomyces sp. NPDC002990]